MLGSVVRVSLVLKETVKLSSKVAILLCISISNKILVYKTIMVDTCHLYLSKSIKCSTSRITPNVNYEIWVIIMGQCKFNNCTKHNTVKRMLIILLEGVPPSWRESMNVWGLEYMGNLLPSAHCCDLKTDIKACIFQYRT